MLYPWSPTASPTTWRIITNVSHLGSGIRGVITCYNPLINGITVDNPQLGDLLTMVIPRAVDTGAACRSRCGTAEAQHAAAGAGSPEVSGALTDSAFGSQGFWWILGIFMDISRDFWWIFDGFFWMFDVFWSYLSPERHGHRGFDMIGSWPRMVGF